MIAYDRLRFAAPAPRSGSAGATTGSPSACGCRPCLPPGESFRGCVGRSADAWCAPTAATGGGSSGVPPGARRPGGAARRTG
ncbi:hypothetical protein J2S46_001215 [Kitasatospora herbaricolor]|nr:hypothetical protein [Kitasatospora herbaricolor]